MVDAALKNEAIRAIKAKTSPAERRACILEWSRILHVHEATIYRWLPPKDRQTRSDAGVRRSALSNEAWVDIVAIRVQYGYTSEELIMHALANGWATEDEIPHPKTITKWLADEGIGGSKMMDSGKGGLAEKAPPHRTFEANAPNKYHQMDITEVPRYLVGQGNEISFASVLTHGKNKRPITAHVHLYAIVDDYSRAAYARLYRSKEVVEWVDFCHRAWSVRESPLMGVPEVLYSDNDSALKATLFHDFADHVGVEIKTHTVGNPKAKGKVERLLQTLQNALIRALRPHMDQGGSVTLEVANQILEGIVSQYNARPHSSTGLPPAVRHQTLSSIRPVPEIPRERHLYREFSRLIRTDWSVSMDGVNYQLPRKEPFTSLIGHTVTILAHHHPAERDVLIVLIDDVEHEIPAQQVVPDVAGEYKGTPKTQGQKTIEEAQARDMTGRFDPMAAYNVPAPQNAVQMPTTAPEEEPAMDRRELKLRLVEDGVTFSVTDVEDIMGDRTTFTRAEYEEIKENFAS